MSKKALVPVNVLASGSTPAGQYAGDLFFKSDEKTVYVYDGTDWMPVSGGNIDGGSPESIFGGMTLIDGGTVI